MKYVREFDFYFFRMVSKDMCSRLAIFKNKPKWQLFLGMSNSRVLGLNKKKTAEQFQRRNCSAVLIIPSDRAWFYDAFMQILHGVYPAFCASFTLSNRSVQVLQLKYRHPALWKTRLFLLPEYAFWTTAGFSVFVLFAGAEEGAVRAKAVAFKRTHRQKTMATKRFFIPRTPRLLSIQ